MELKKYIRRGIFDEAHKYKPLVAYKGNSPENIILLLEGKCRRKIHLGKNRLLYENYYPTSFIGLEDFILKKTRVGGVGLYPGSHYVMWKGDDFMNTLIVHPELAQRAIFELSRRIRIYDAHQHSIDSILKIERNLEIGPPESDLTDTLYELSFAEKDELPPAIIKRLGQKFTQGEYLIKQGDNTNELYIIIEGNLTIFQTDENGNRRDLDSLSAGDMLGEMAQFDGLPRSANAVADSDVHVIVFNPENFHLLFSLHPKWSIRLLNTLAGWIELRLTSFETIDLSNFER